MKRIFTLMLLLFAALLQNNAVYSQAGTLDPSFSDDGIALFNFNSLHETAYGIITFEDTSSMLCGTGDVGSFFNSEGFLLKLKPDGTRDSTWGVDGLIVYDLGEDTFFNDMILQPDGKILVSGIVYTTSSDSEMLLARFNPDGTFDMTFNGTGYFLSTYSTAEEICEAMALQADGKIVLAGRTYLGSFSQMLFARVNSNGTIDNSFGTNGYTEINSSVQDEQINSLGILSNGTIVGLGYGYLGSPWWGEKVHMAKLTPHGVPMPGFGTNGVIVPGIFTDISVAFGLDVVNDSILVTGWMYDASNNTEMYLAKLDSTGVADASFGNGGIQLTYLNVFNAGLMVMKAPDGKIYACGTSGLGGPSARDFLLVRYMEDGSLDNSFNGTGYVTTTIRQDWDEAITMAMQVDGKLILAGMSGGLTSSGNNDIPVVRYLNDFTPAGCYANFTANNTLTCEGSQVNFTDLTVSTDSTVISWNWTFEGGTPSTSTLQNPTITYTAAGVYDVTLAVYDGIYYDTLTMEDYITVEAIPATPGTPGGLSELCSGYDADYTTTSVAYADEYDWQVTPSSAGTITGNTTTANFTASSSFTGTATIQVRAQGMCGNSPWSSGFPVEVHHNPEFFSMTGNGAFCEGSAGAEVGLDGSETGVNYELYLAGNPTGIIIAGTGSAISFGAINTIGLYTVSGYTDHCSEFMIGQVYVHEEPIPGQANTPNGPDQVCDHDTSTYVTLQIDDADVYIWTLDPEEAGEMTIVFDTAHIAWNHGWTGKAYLSAHGENVCGEGAESEVLEIDVYLDPEPALSGPGLVCSGFEETYETAENPGSFYTWEVEGGVVTSGPGTHMVTILWGDAGDGWITVMEETEAGCSTTTDEFAVTIEECTSVPENLSKFLKIHPNPVKDKLFLNISAEKKSEKIVSIHTISGKKMLEQTITQGFNQTNYSIDVSHLPPGLYLLKVISEEGSLITGKFIKN